MKQTFSGGYWQKYHNSSGQGNATCKNGHISFNFITHYFHDYHFIDHINVRFHSPYVGVSRIKENLLLLYMHGNSILQYKYSNYRLFTVVDYGYYHFIAYYCFIHYHCKISIKHTCIIMYMHAYSI